METRFVHSGSGVWLGLPTRWGTQLNGNVMIGAICISSSLKAPHSLGNPIEWKLTGINNNRISRKTPHSLGNPIEWKRSVLAKLGAKFGTPHSLGNPIEWKPHKQTRVPRVCSVAPHSLGNPIEWKHLSRSQNSTAMVLSPLAGEPN